MKIKPKPHQKELLDVFGASLDPVLLAGCVGSGKTYATILLDIERRKSFQKANPTLVVVPASVKSQWAEVLEDLGLAVSVIDGAKKKRLRQIEEITRKAKNNTAEKMLVQYVVTNYDTVRIHWDWFQQHNWYHVILDEAHAIKNPTALRTYSCKAINCYSRICMTGTPIANKPNDLWSLLHFLNPGSEYPHKKRNYRGKRDRIPAGMRMRAQSPSWGSWMNFTERYCQRDRWGSIIRGRNLGDLNKRLDGWIVRWKKEDVLASLPPVTTRTEVIELSSSQKKLYKNMRAGLFEWMEEHGEILQALKSQDPKSVRQSVTSILAQMTYFRRIASMSPTKFAESMARKTPVWAQGINIKPSGTSAKLEWIRDFIDYRLDDDDSLVVLTNWADTANELAEQLAVYKPSVITGATRNRGEVVRNFDKLFIGTSAAFEGVDGLQKASTLIWVDLPWTAKDLTQGNGRISRIGQEKACDVFYLLAAGTVDTKMYEKLGIKASDIAKAIDGGFTKELVQFGLEGLI